MKEAKAAIAGQSSAHLEFDAGSTTSSATEQIVADVGASVGTETVTDGVVVLHVKGDGGVRHQRVGLGPHLPA